jgi:Cu+-exporting ATPase
MLTGESLPVKKGAGDRVIGGTINRTGAFRYQATTLGEGSVLAQIVRLMRDAQGSRAPIQRLAGPHQRRVRPGRAVDRHRDFTTWFVAAHATGTPAGAALVRCVRGRGRGAHHRLPVRDGARVPTAVMVSTGKGAELGVLIKGGEALQRAGDVTTVVLDKTGTVTEGASHGHGRALPRAGAAPLGRATCCAGRVARDVERAPARRRDRAARARARASRWPAPEAFASRPGAARRASSAARARRRATRAHGRVGGGPAPLAADAERLAGEGKTPMYVASTARSPA